MLPLKEIFCLIDDFCKYFEQQNTKTMLPNPNRKRQRNCSLSISEIMTIVIMFHFSHYRTFFKDFYYNSLQKQYIEYFPQLVSYTHMLELMPYALMPLAVMIQVMPGKNIGQYYIDSTKLAVCDNLRNHNHKVFAGCAKRGKTSAGWFFGFKLHLVINRYGELMRFSLTPGDTDDRAIVASMIEGLEGWLFGDKGYISASLFEKLKKQGVELITKVRKNMKKQILEPAKKYLLSKRGMVESAIDQAQGVIAYTTYATSIHTQLSGECIGWAYGLYI